MTSALTHYDDICPTAMQERMMIIVGQNIYSPIVVGFGLLLLVLWGLAALAGIVGLTRALRGVPKNADLFGMAAMGLGALPASVWLLLLVTSGDLHSVLVSLFFSFLNPWGWLVVSPMILGFTAWRMHKRRLVLPGRCAKCHYDLRGSQDSATCPECGKPMAKPT